MRSCSARSAADETVEAAGRRVSVLGFDNWAGGAGEGAPYTGLKPAGRDLGPAIPAGDKALETGSVEPVVKLLTDAVQEGMREQFKVVMSKRNFGKDNVAAGREFIEAYVEYIHYVERIYEATKEPAIGHYPESGAPAHKD